MRCVAIVLAAGSGERIGEPGPKAFLPIGGRTMLELAVDAAVRCPEIDVVVVAVPSGREEEARALLQAEKVRVVAGGDTRQASVRAALDTVPDDAEGVAVHDAARCFATPALFSAVLGALDGADGAVPIVGVADTVKRVRGGEIVETVPRDELGSAQTPQAFRIDALRAAHDRAATDGFLATDDAALLEHADLRVIAVAGEDGNFKVTTRADLERARAMRGGSDD